MPKVMIDGKWEVQGAWSHRVHWCEVTPQKATALARAHKQPVPRMGYEVYLRHGVRLVNVSGTYEVRAIPNPDDPAPGTGPDELTHALGHVLTRKPGEEVGA